MMGDFKVLIAGGSLVGLTLAISLERAGIDYELFEKEDFAPQLGASIGFYPQSNQLMDQFGIEQSFTSEYKCLFAVSRNDPVTPFLPNGTVHNVYHQDHSALAATGVPGLVFWFLFIRTPITRTPHCPRYTDADADALAHEYGHVTPGPGYTIRDLWTARVKGSLVSLEEGIVSQWSHGRILLLGDAAHKVTPNAGFGGNLALEGVAHLTNALVALLRDSSSGAAPTIVQLAALFAEFDRSHRPRATTVLGLSATITRYEAQQTGILRFAARYLSPVVPDRWKAALFVRFASGAPRLEFLPVKTVAAVEVDVEGRGREGGGTGKAWLAVGLVGAVVAVGLARFRK